MASLEELRKRIYRPKESFEERMHEPTLERPGKPKPSFEPAEKLVMSKFPKKRWPWIVGGGAFLILGGAIIFLIFAPTSFFETHVVDVTIEGPKEIESGARVSWTLEVVNRSGSTMENASVVFNFPEEIGRAH